MLKSISLTEYESNRVNDPGTGQTLAWPGGMSYEPGDIYSGACVGIGLEHCVDSNIIVDGPREKRDPMTLGRN
jgi:hypothetical protein